MLWPKKNSYKEFDNKKRFLPLENSPPSPLHNFSNGPTLRSLLSERKLQRIPARDEIQETPDPSLRVVETILKQSEDCYPAP